MQRRIQLNPKLIFECNILVDRKPITKYTDKKNRTFVEGRPNSKFEIEVKAVCDSVKTKSLDDLIVIVFVDGFNIVTGTEDVNSGIVFKDNTVQKNTLILSERVSDRTKQVVPLQFFDGFVGITGAIGIRVHAKGQKDCLYETAIYYDTAKNLERLYDINVRERMKSPFPNLQIDTII